MANARVPDEKAAPYEQCGFCSKGTYSWDDGRKSPCPYCHGTGKQVPLSATKEPSDGR